MRWNSNDETNVSDHSLFIMPLFQNTHTHTLTLKKMLRKEALSDLTVISDGHSNP